MGEGLRHSVPPGQLHHQRWERRGRSGRQVGPIKRSSESEAGFREGSGGVERGGSSVGGSEGFGEGEVGGEEGRAAAAGDLARRGGPNKDLISFVYLK